MYSVQVYTKEKIYIKGRLLVWRYTLICLHTSWPVDLLRPAVKGAAILKQDNKENYIFAGGKGRLENHVKKSRDYTIYYPFKLRGKTPARVVAWALAGISSRYISQFLGSPDPIQFKL